MIRVRRVAQVLLTNWKQTIGWPIAILALSFVCNLAFYAAIGDDIDGERISGGVISIYVFQVILASQTLTQAFSFAVGLNVTRKTFFTAASIVLGLLSLTFAVLLYVLSMVEQATDGWGVRMVYFTVLPMTRTHSPLTIVVFLVPMLLFSFIGLFIGVVAKRWGTNGVLSLVMLAIAVFGGGAVLITWLEGWPNVWHWLVDQPPLALAAGWTLLPLAALVVGSYGLTRRAVP